MTDNGLAALAAALETVMRDSIARAGGPYAALGSPEITITFDRPAFAAAILDALDSTGWRLTARDKASPNERTIATLRAALLKIERVVAAWEADDIWEMDEAMPALRAALAAAKETP
jgi:hypothetical protein